MSMSKYLNSDDEYGRWREEKLANFPDFSDIVVDISDPARLSPSEEGAIQGLLKRAGMAVFRGPKAKDVDEAKAIINGFGKCLGLGDRDKNPYADRDAITPLHVAAGNARKEKAQKEGGRSLYIPYTDRAINWHTDGYYNPPDRYIRTMALYCVTPALEGGENSLFDPEIAYIMMRDADPAMVEAMCHPKAMTIPANDMDDAVNRGDETGPVFSKNENGGSLYMRYTARKKNIVWRDDDATHRAVEFLENLLSGPDAPNSPYMFKYRLAPGEGLICNNVLHTRTAFKDGEGINEKRLILRGRYNARIDQ